jgi:hypothetical protein
MGKVMENYAKLAIQEWTRLDISYKIKMYNDYLMGAMREVDMILSIDSTEDLVLVAEQGFDKVRKLVDGYRNTIKTTPYFEIREDGSFRFIDENIINNIIMIFGEEIFEMVLEHPYWFDEIIFDCAMKDIFRELKYGN